MLGILPLLLVGSGLVVDDYTDSILKSRAEMEAGLRSEEGWLAVAGLVWLKDGQRVAYDQDAGGHPVVPATGTGTGTIYRKGDALFVEISGNAERELNPDSGDSVVIGSGTLFSIRRGDRIGIRVYDSESAARKNFTGQKWFAVDPKLKIVATFVAYPEPKKIKITNVLGDVSDSASPGYVTFNVKGVTCRLEAEDEGTSLFFNFRDKTSGKETYGAGRFLNTAKAVDGKVVLDFNMAVNPPCAFTSFATCPLPPKGNELAVEIRAGELAHHPK